MSHNFCPLLWHGFQANLNNCTESDKGKEEVSVVSRIYIMCSPPAPIIEAISVCVRTFSGSLAIFSFDGPFSILHSKYTAL